MTIVNGEEIPVYGLDTRDSTITRIAVGLNTLPKFLRGVPDPIGSDPINVQDLLKIVKKDAAKSSNLIKFLKKYKDLIDGSETEIVKLWIVYNQELEKLSAYSPIVLDQTSKELVEQGYFTSDREFRNYWNTRADVKRQIELSIRELKVQDDKFKSLYSSFEAVEDGLVYTDFKTEKVFLDLNMDLKDITLLELFNGIVLNRSAPFAVCKNYYKILKGYTPPEDWAVETENDISLRICEKIDIDPSRVRDFTDVRMYVEGEISDENVGGRVRLVTERGYLSKESFIERLSGVFPSLAPITYKKVEEKEVVGIFYFPMERVNTYVFADLVMNNSVFNSIVSIDESNKATKKKSESAQPWLYIHFTHPSTGHITASIGQKIADRTDPEIREEDPEIFPHGEPYIRVRAKGRDVAAIKYFQDMLARLLVIYGERYNEIVDDYQKFIPDFGIVVEQDIKPLKQGDMAPEVFVSNFSRYCNETRQPTIVSAAKAEKHKSKGKEVMVFPRDRPTSDDAVRYLSDGVNQNFYICKNPEYPYPGLQVNNKLSNSKEYPFLPCCFKNQQSEKVNSVFRHYYLGEDLESKDKKQQDLIITDKILGNAKFGNLPESLGKIFELLDTDTNYKYIRLGVDRSKSSFLQAVMTGIYDVTGILELTSQAERAERMIEIRKQMSDPGVCVAAKQSCPQMTVAEISAMVSDPEVYFDPKLFCQLLETYFQCPIYLFNRTMIVQPNSLKGYYRTKISGNAVFIYENWGSEADNAQYPQCELIVRWRVKKTDEVEYGFSPETKIAKTVKGFFRTISQFYNLSEKIVYTLLPLPSKISIVGQEIDSYGKTRRLDVKYQKKFFTLLTDPIPPVQVLETKDPIIETDIDSASDIIAYMGGALESQTLESADNPVVVQLNTVIGNVKVSIPVKKSNKFDIPIEYGSKYPMSVKSSLQIFNHNKRISRYMTEYLFWAFSKYLEESKVDEITDKVLSKFAAKSFTINPTHEYGDIPKFFGNNNSIMTGGRLVVHSEDMIKRMMYVLKLYSVRDLKSLREYRRRKVIRNYYDEISDFTHYPGQVILEGEDSVERWLQETDSISIIRKTVDVGRKGPYFFSNPLVVNGKVFLAQNTTSLRSAIGISKTWYLEGYNNPYLDSKRNRSQFTLFSYSGEDDISEMDVQGEKVDYSIRILGYKISGQPFYTSLLEV